MSPHQRGLDDAIMKLCECRCVRVHMWSVIYSEDICVHMWMVIYRVYCLQLICPGSAVYLQILNTFHILLWDLDSFPVLIPQLLLLAVRIAQGSTTCTASVVYRARELMIGVEWGLGMRLHPTRLVVKGIKRIGCTASRARTNQLQALLQVTIGVLEDWE